MNCFSKLSFRTYKPNAVFQELLQRSLVVTNHSYSGNHWFTRFSKKSSSSLQGACLVYRNFCVNKHVPTSQWSRVAGQVLSLWAKISNFSFLSFQMLRLWPPLLLLLLLLLLYYYYYYSGTAESEEYTLVWPKPTNEPLPSTFHSQSLFL
jgi:hypothetical protein